jgi:hypothetical protein
MGSPLTFIKFNFTYVGVQYILILYENKHWAAYPNNGSVTAAAGWNLDSKLASIIRPWVAGIDIPLQEYITKLGFEHAQYQ